MHSGNLSILLTLETRKGQVAGQIVIQFSEVLSVTLGLTFVEKERGH